MWTAEWLESPLWVCERGGETSWERLGVSVWKRADSIDCECRNDSVSTFGQRGGVWFYVCVCEPETFIFGSWLRVMFGCTVSGVSDLTWYCWFLHYSIALCFNVNAPSPILTSSISPSFALQPDTVFRDGCFPWKPSKTHTIWMGQRSGCTPALLSCLHCSLDTGPRWELSGLSVLVFQLSCWTDTLFYFDEQLCSSVSRQ